MAQTPWWSHIFTIAVGWLLKVLYDWQVGPFITKSLRKKEKKETEEEQIQKRIRKEKLNNLNIAWREGRKILQDLKQPLKEFNQMDRFPDEYKAQKCLELASQIARGAEKITWLKFQSIKEKILEYARRKDQIDQNTPLHVLKNIFQRRVEPNKYEPLVLCDEIEEVLRNSSTPPFSEEDLKSLLSPNKK